MHTTCAPAQKTTTTRNRSIDCSLLTWWERKTLPIWQWRKEVEKIGIQHAIEKISSEVGFSQLMNARQAVCTSFELVAVGSVEDLVRSLVVGLK